MGSADLKWIGIATDNTEWYIKTVEENPLLPASEWLCHKVATACGLPTPYFSVVDHEDNGTPVFGSRCEHGTSGLTGGPIEQLKRLSECCETMSSTIAIDLVVANTDRHAGNFLYRENSQGGWISFVIDWSRAFLINGNPPPDILSKICNTRSTVDILRQLNIWQSSSALVTITGLSAIKPAHISDWLDEAPSQWISAADRGKLLQWWGSQAYTARLNAVASACK